jgi:ferredoxin-NADP reductase
VKKFYVQAVENIDNYLLLTLRPRRQRDMLRFYPGQYATIGFMVDGRPSPMRCFSMVSSPNKPNELQFAMRVQGNFTQAVQKLEVGAQVQLQGPYGDFAIDPAQDKNIIMLAGGIGITPFVSMIRYMTETKQPTPMTLVYGCRSQSDIPFYQELVDLQKINQNLRVILFVNDGNITSQPGISILPGRVDQAVLSKLTNQRYNNFTYFICGPDSFRNSLEGALEQQQVDPSRVLTESFNQVSNGGGILGYSIPKITYALSGIALVGLIAFIMTLDLSRNLPKVAAAATVVPASSNSVSAPTVNTPVPTNTSNTVTTTPTVTNSYSTPSYNNTYQMPTSSVS